MSEDRKPMCIPEEGVPGGHSHLRGWPITWDGYDWRYDDDSSLIPASGGKMRPCMKCGAMMNDHESDHCLGTLPGVDNACCGHGRREDAFIRFNNGLTITGFYVCYRPIEESHD
jgi:hypothetical protein